MISKLDNIYTIQDLVDGKVINSHITNLREYLYEPVRTNPKDIAVQNRGEFFTEDLQWSSKSDGLVMAQNIILESLTKTLLTRSN